MTNNIQTACLFTLFRSSVQSDNSFLKRYQKGPRMLSVVKVDLFYLYLLLTEYFPAPDREVHLTGEGRFPQHSQPQTHTEHRSFADWYKRDRQSIGP